jgi:protein AroM
MSRLGIITIGQTPRTDLTPELQGWLPGVELVELGALDGLTQHEIEDLRPRVGNEVLTSRLANGTAAIVGAEQISAKLQQAIRALESDVDAILLACTGGFPEFEHQVPLIKPDSLITHGTAALTVCEGPIGVICPLPEQAEETRRKFQVHLPAGAPVLTESVSPYTGTKTELKAAGGLLRDRGASLIVLDCMGYTEGMRKTVAAASMLPVLLARSVVARLAAEVLDSVSVLQPLQAAER